MAANASCRKPSVHGGAAIVILCAALLYVGQARAQNAPPAAQGSGKPGRASQAAGKAPTPMMEQHALELLKSMSATLSATRAFTYRSRSTVEVPAKTGQFVTLFAQSDVALQRPNKLSVRVTGEAPNFDFYYDGKTFAAYSANNHVYSIDSAPENIDGMLKVIEQKTGIHFPSADVMFSDPYAMLTNNLVSAFVVGPATVDGQACEHLAFISRGVNWEIWIDSGERALPRRLAVTYTDAQNLPRFLVEFSDWNLQPNLAEADFGFKPPADAKQVPFSSRTAPLPQKTIQ